MPVDDLGVRADFISAPEPIFNRMNCSQFYEQFISVICRIILHKIKTQGLDDNSWRLLIGLFQDCNPEYRKVVEEAIYLDKDKKQLMSDFLDMQMIPVVIPPALDRMRTDWVLHMLEKYDVENYVTPVEYDLCDRQGNKIRRVRTRRSVYIGHKYTYLLCKIPYCKSCGMGYINQWQIPITVKNTATKNLYPIALTAIRIGEDETRNFITNIGSALTARILCLYANSPQSTEHLGYTLITELHPSTIPWLDETTMELKKKSRTIQIMKAITTTVGIDLNDPIATEDELEFFNECNPELDPIDDSDD